MTEFQIEANNYADRIIALDWRDKPVKSEIAGDWEAGYVMGSIDGEKAARESAKPLVEALQQMIGQYSGMNETIGEKRTLKEATEALTNYNKK